MSTEYFTYKNGVECSGDVYYLIVNDGKVGPFTSEQIALRKYRDMITSGILVLSAYIMFGSSVIRRN